MNVGELRRLIANVDDDALLWIATDERGETGQRFALTTIGPGAVVPATQYRPPVVLIEAGVGPGFVEFPPP